MYIVVGANGFLGSYVVRSLVSNTDEQIIATYHGKKENLYYPRVNWINLDVTDTSSIQKLAEIAENIAECRIFYFAACHNLDLVKREPELAKSINITALENFLEIFKDADCLYFSSTDCVYGENTDDIKAFKETDPTCPVSEYGRQKLEAEQIVRNFGFNVVRLPYMTGASLLENKKHFQDTIAEKTAEGQDFTLADGLWRSALDYGSVADILLKLSMMKNVPDTLNVCGDESLSKYDVGMLIAQKYNLPTEHIIKTPESEIMKIFDEKRTSSTAMDNSLLKSVLGVEEIKIRI